jgi:hypothetical protein
MTNDDRQKSFRNTFSIIGNESSIEGEENQPHTKPEPHTKTNNIQNQPTTHSQNNRVNNVLTMALSSVLFVSSNLNNKSVSLIKEGRHDEAIVLLEEAITTVVQVAKGCPHQEQEQEQVAEMTTKNDTNDIPSESTGYIGSFGVCPSGDLASSTQTEEAMALDCSDVDGGAQSPYLYQEPVTVSGLPPASVDPDDAISAISFVILFNLSLAHHLSGISATEHEVGIKRLRTAQRLYECSFRLQAQNSHVDMLIATALVNNLSLVHKSLGDYYEAQQCDELLLSYVVLLVDMGVVSSARQGQQATVDGFLGNVMHLVMAEAATASAA